MGIFDHSFKSAFVRSDTDVGENAWLAVSTLIHHKGFSLELRGQAQLLTVNPNKLQELKKVFI